MTGPPLVSSGSAGPMGKRGTGLLPPPAGMGSGWGPATWASVWNRGSSGGRPRQAFWLYQQAVEMGSLSAVCNLGVCYEQGSAPLQTRKGGGAVPASGGARLLPGQRLLARCLEQGLGLPQDQKGCPGMAADLRPSGDASSQAELARHYEFGVGTEISPSRPYSGTAVRLRQGMRTDSAVWAG